MSTIKPTSKLFRRMKKKADRKPVTIVCNSFKELRNKLNING